MTTNPQLVTGVDFVPVPDPRPAGGGRVLRHDARAAAIGLCPERHFAEFETGNLTLTVIDADAMGIGHNVNANAIALHVEDVQAARAALEAQRRELRRRDSRHERMPHGLLHRPGRKRADAPPPLRAAHDRSLSVRILAHAGPQPLEMTLLPGARALLAVHARELPQRDDLCGAFCGALALRAAGIETHDGEPLDQDAVALAAGQRRLRRARRRHPSARRRRPARLPAVAAARRGPGRVRNDRRRAARRDRSGSPAERSRRSPTAARGRAGTLAGLFDLAAALERPVTLVANLATRHLWGGRASVNQLLGYLFDGEQDGPPPDWDVGHFACVVARVRGPGGSLYGVADTYPAARRRRRARAAAGAAGGGARAARTCRRAA